MKIPLGPAIAVAGVAIVAAMVAGGWWWWQSNAERLKESATAALEEGHRAGQSLTESGCVAGATTRHKDTQNQTIVETVRTSLILRGCLDASKAEPKFCAGVPAKDEVLGRATWSAGVCSSAGLTDSYCGQMMNQVVEYCASAQRASKL